METIKIEYTNCCKNCGAIDTLWPKWIGRKRIYVCESCGVANNGCKPSQYKAKGGVTNV